jgi:hypothetical protein
VQGSLGTMAVLLLETALGGLALLWLAPLWGLARPGFFRLTGALLSLTAVLAWATARASLVAPAGKAGTAVLLIGVFAAATVVWYALLWLAPALGRWAGIAACLPGAAAVVLVAASSGRQIAAAVTALLAGALFLGACVDGLLLGHWYLVDRKLSNKPIRALAVWLLVGVGAAVVSGLLGTERGGVRPALSPLLAIPNLTMWLALGFAAVVGLLAWFIRVLVRGGSIQAATGMFYLAVIMAVAAEFSAKVYFFAA